MIKPTANWLTANAALNKKPVIRVEIDTYPRVFTTVATGVSGEYDWIEEIDDQPATVDELQGGADLGELSFTVLDKGGAITGDFPTFVFEGKKIALKHGFVGLSTSDYLPLFTGKIDTVPSVNSNTAYQFNCSDAKQSLAQVIFTTADDGRPTDSDNLRTLNGHPIDLLIAALINELGQTANVDFKTERLLIMRNGVFAGLNFVFEIDTPPVASDWIEQQILKPLGGWYWTNNLGQLDFNFFYRDTRVAGNSMGAVGAFVDSGGVIIGLPFPLPLTLGGDNMTVTVPAGASHLQFGASDGGGWGDNIGAWNLDVSGSSVAVSGQSRPWNSSSNPNFTASESGSSSPASISVTPGASLVITYVNGTVQVGVGFPFVSPIGNVGVAAALPESASYAISAPSPVISEFSLTNDNMMAIPEAGQEDLVNQVSFRFDKTTDGKFLASEVESYGASVSKYGLFGSQEIESDGMRSGFQGYFLGAFTSRMIFYRYGLKNLTFEEVTVFWPACVLEQGDIVDMTSDKVPDRAAGVMGISGRLFEVLDRTRGFMDGVVTLRLLDASYLNNFGQYLIAANGTAAYTSASTDEKAHDMFMANDSDQYSDASAAHVLG